MILEKTKKIKLIMNKSVIIIKPFEIKYPYVITNILFFEKIDEYIRVNLYVDTTHIFSSICMILKDASTIINFLSSIISPKNSISIKLYDEINNPYELDSIIYWHEYTDVIKDRNQEKIENEKQWNLMNKNENKMQ